MDAVELARFHGHVLRGPTATDCWFWTGAIADDGYGRFWVRRDGRQRAVRPHRHLFEHVHGVSLLPAEQLMHECDIPICVRVTDDATTHLSVGSNGANMRDREQKHRAGRDALHMRGLSRKQLAGRSRALRAVLLERGFDRGGIAAVLADVPLYHPTLF